MTEADLLEGQYGSGEITRIGMGTLANRVRDKLDFARVHTPFARRLVRSTRSQRELQNFSRNVIVFV